MTFAEAQELAAEFTSRSSGLGQFLAVPDANGQFAALAVEHYVRLDGKRTVVCAPAYDGHFPQNAATRVEIMEFYRRRTVAELKAPRGAERHER